MYLNPQYRYYTRNQALDGGNRDPYFSNVVLLVQEGSGTTFTDLSSSAHALTGAGNVAWVTTGSLPAGASSVMAFDGSGDYVESADSAAWALGSGEWTREGYLWSDGVTGVRWMLSQMPSSGNGAWFDGRNGAALRSGYTTAGTWQDKVINAGTIVTQTWTHWATVRDGNTLRGYLGGSQVATFDMSTDSIFDDNAVLRIGASEDGAVFWNGRQTSIRITKGVCRYPSGTSFTPPTLPLPTS